MARVLNRVRRLLTIVATATAVLSAGLWVRSRIVADVITVRTHRRFADASVDYPEPVACSLATDAGTLTAAWRRGDFGIPYELRALYPSPGGRPRWAWTVRPPTVGTGGFARGGVSFFHRGQWDEDRWVRVPLWFVTATLTLPAAALLGRRRHTPLFACHRCGYDLRATPARCPECGAVPATLAR